MSRTVVLSPPRPDVLSTADAVIEGLRAAVAAARPGATCAEVEGAWRAAVRPRGITKASRLGYSIGLSYPPTIGERTLSLRPGDETELTTDMTLHLIPGIWTETVSVVISQAVRITDSGPELLGELPWDPVVK
jgi:Xaa-Pro aminopeptidase